MSRAGQRDAGGRGTLCSCPRCATWPRSTPASARPTSTTCTGSPVTGSCSPTCPSPTCCCGCRSGPSGRARVPLRRPGAARRPRRPRTRTTRSARIVGGPEVAHLDVAYRQGADLARGRPGLVRRRCRPGTRRSRSGCARRRRGRRGDRGARPGHQPVHRAHPEPAGAELPAPPPTTWPRWSPTGPSRRPAPGRDDLGAAGRRRADPARRRRQGHLRQPERAVGVPPARRHRRTWSGEELAELTSRLADDPLDGTDAGRRHRWPRCAARRPPRQEVEARGATVLFRALPLLPAGVPIGALVLVRDVTEVRRRDRALHDQGRHHPGDPPPGEEQPADGRRAAAPAGPPGVDRPRPGPRWRSRCAGSPRSRWCTRRCRCRMRRGGRVRRDRRPGGDARRRGGRGRA